MTTAMVHYLHVYRHILYLYGHILNLYGENSSNFCALYRRLSSISQSINPQHRSSPKNLDSSSCDSESCDMDLILQGHNNMTHFQGHDVNIFKVTAGMAWWRWGEVWG